MQCWKFVNCANQWGVCVNFVSQLLLRACKLKETTQKWFTIFSIEFEHCKKREPIERINLIGSCFFHVISRCIQTWALIVVYVTVSLLLDLLRLLRISGKKCKKLTMLMALSKFSAVLSIDRLQQNQLKFQSEKQNKAKQNSTNNKNELCELHINIK